MVLDLQKVKKPATIAISVAIVAVIVLTCLVYLPVVIPEGQSSEVVINEGQGLNQIASLLKSEGLIRSETIFVLFARLIGESTSLKAGRYVFTESLNIPTIIDTLVSGKSESDDLEITIPEGMNIWDMDEHLTKIGFITKGQFSSKYYNSEGYLFPDTYRINQQEPLNKSQQIEDLREKMGLNFNNKTEELFKNLNTEQRLRTIIIASMLEKEARTEEDMRLVAGIIEKRLELDILLQIDATVVYGACRRIAMTSGFTRNCDVTFQGPAIEIKIDGPFNTYTRKGLPPAPISNPGLKAINAALNPKTSDYLFYLSTRDGSQMIYSKTAGEHSANRRKYLGI